MRPFRGFCKGSVGLRFCRVPGDKITARKRKSPPDVGLKGPHAERWVALSLFEKPQVSEASQRDEKLCVTPASA